MATDWQLRVHLVVAVVRYERRVFLRYFHVTQPDYTTIFSGEYLPIQVRIVIYACRDRIETAEITLIV